MRASAMLTITAAFIAITIALPLSARERFGGYVYNGGQAVLTSGLISSTKVQRSYPGALVTVLVGGTSTPAALYDSSGASKPNPLSADTTGYFFFYADDGLYDIQFSGAGIPIPFTWPAIRLLSGVSIGAVTDYGALSDTTNGTGSINSGTSSLTTTTSMFSSASVGKRIAILGAGGTGLSLDTTINGYVGPTQVTLAQNATVSVSGAPVFTGTDNTAAIQLALNSVRSVYMPPGSYGFTTGLRMRTSSALYSGCIECAALVRLGPGSGDPAISMKAGNIAEGLAVHDFILRAAQVGTALDGINLGTETQGLTDLALGAYVQNVQVWDATGWSFNLFVNAPGQLDNLWSEQALTTSVQSSAGGFHIAGGEARVGTINIEGNFPLGGLLFEVGGLGYVKHVQCETAGTNAGTDLITLNRNGAAIDSVYVFGGGTLRDLVKITGGAQYACVGRVHVEPSHPTFTNVLNDVAGGNASGNAWLEFPGYCQYNPQGMTDFNAHGAKRISTADGSATMLVLSNPAAPVADTASPADVLFQANNLSSTLLTATKLRASTTPRNGFTIPDGDFAIFTAQASVGTLLDRFHVRPDGSVWTAANTKQLVSAGGDLTPTSAAFAGLGTPANGTVYYCSDCANQSNPCAGAGSGAIAKRLNGAWDCR